MSNLYVDIHALQVIPPSCVNRDDTGSPKTAVYGGVTRARVSSQCWKNAVRSMFNEVLPKSEVGIRTKHICNLIANEIDRLGGLSPKKQAEAILKNGGLQLKAAKSEDDLETGALYFISPAQIKALARLAVENPAAKKPEIQAVMKAEPSLDVALFGRMVADDPSLNTDACCQVAHSISTHKISNEYDYFTAQDDCSPADNAGAGMIGTVEFNSSTLYRYATIAVHALKDNLEENTVDAVKAFVDAFIRSMPTGKINTFANRTLPSAVMVTIREDQPVNLVGAFEKPVKASDNGYVDGSCQALVAHAKATYRDWLAEPRRCFVIGDGLDELGENVTLKEMLKRLGDEIESLI